jgi:predicted RNase H-like HicB family nuclease
MTEIAYEIILYWSKDDGAFVAEVPELPGCAADGATYQEAVANAERVIQEWLETARESGRPVPAPRGRLLYAHSTGDSLPGDKKESPELEQTFERLVDIWSSETGAYSITTRRYSHPAYQAILALGKDVVPLILRRLKERPDWWFEALTALTKPKINPAVNGATFSEAVDSWLEWGRRNQLVT